MFLWTSEPTFQYEGFFDLLPLEKCDFCKIWQIFGLFLVILASHNSPTNLQNTHIFGFAGTPSLSIMTLERIRQYRKTGWLGPLGWLGPNLKTTFKPQIYQFFLYLVVKDLKKTPDFLSTKSQIWFNTDKSKILPLFTEIWPLPLCSYFPVPESRND